ncbi:hypothetical protein JCM8097_000953 [Rhodosporidiobolus ruineniae]
MPIPPSYPTQLSAACLADLAPVAPSILAGAQHQLGARGHVFASGGAAVALWTHNAVMQGSLNGANKHKAQALTQRVLLPGSVNVLRIGANTEAARPVVNGAVVGYSMQNFPAAGPLKQRVQQVPPLSLRPRLTLDLLGLPSAAFPPPGAINPFFARLNGQGSLLPRFPVLAGLLVRELSQREGDHFRFSAHWKDFNITDELFHFYVCIVVLHLADSTAFTGADAAPEVAAWRSAWNERQRAVLYRVAHRVTTDDVNGLAQRIAHAVAQKIVLDLVDPSTGEVGQQRVGDFHDEVFGSYNDVYDMVEDAADWFFAELRALQEHRPPPQASHVQHSLAKQSAHDDAMRFVPVARGE